MKRVRVRTSDVEEINVKKESLQFLRKIEKHIEECLFSGSLERAMRKTGASDAQVAAALENSREQLSETKQRIKELGLN